MKVEWTDLENVTRIGEVLAWAYAAHWSAVAIIRVGSEVYSSPISRIRIVE